MTAKRWQQIKTEDRLEADREYRADPAIHQRFMAAWGASRESTLDLNASVSLGATTASRRSGRGTRSRLER